MLVGTIKKNKEVIIIKVRAVVALGEAGGCGWEGNLWSFWVLTIFCFLTWVRLHGSSLYNWLSCTLIFYAFFVCVLYFTIKKGFVLLSWF